MMRVGLVGPASGDVSAFERKVKLLVDRLGCERVHYLGSCDVLERAADARARELGLLEEEGYEGRALSLARGGSTEEIDGFLRARDALARLDLCRAVPLPPVRTIEMLDDRILLMVHDKSLLEEEDLANADLVAYGAADAPLLRKIGPRIFITPGPVEAGYAVATLDERGSLTLAVYDGEGRVLAEEALAPRSARFSVTS